MTSYPDTTPYRAKGRGDRRPGSLRAAMPIKVHRAAAQRRVAALTRKGPGKGAHTISPPPKTRGVQPL